MIVGLLHRRYANALRQCFPQLGELAVYQHPVTRLGLRLAAGAAGRSVRLVGAGHDRDAGLAAST